MRKSGDEKKGTASKLVLNKKYLTQIARNSLFNGFIGLDEIVLVMAEDASYSDILYGLWSGFQCNLRSPVEDFDVESERESVEVYSKGNAAGRTRLWFDLLHRWAGLGVQGVRSGLADIKLLPLYKFDTSSGELRKSQYLGREVGVDYVRLEDLKGYLDDLKLPSPSRLFPSLASGEFISPDNVFRKDGDGWYICFAGKGFRLRNLTGLEYLWQLLGAPNQPIHASSLATMKIDPLAISATDGSEKTRESINKMAMGRLTSSDEPPGRTPLDKENLTDSSSIDRNYTGRTDTQTKNKFKLRLRQVEEQLRECNNPEDRLVLKEEKKDLYKTVNPFARPISSESDQKSRKSISNAIRRVYEKIGGPNPELKTYLERHIKLGNICYYHPDVSNPIFWKF